MMRVNALYLALFVLFVQMAYAEVDQWVPANNGLGDLNVLSLVVDAEDRLFAGTKTGKIFRSIDGGENWTDVTNGIDLYEINELAAAPGGTLYAAAKYPLEHASFIYRSTDYGETWAPFDEGLPELYTIFCLKIAPNGVPHLVVDSRDFYQTIFKFSETTGRWEQAESFPGNIVEIIFDGADVIYLGEGNLLYGGHCAWVSKDGGQTFDRLGDFPGYASGVSAMHVDADGYFYAASPMPNRLDWDWVSLTDGLPDPNVYTTAMLSRPTPYGDMFIATDRYGVFRTVRHGAVWEPVNRGLTTLNLTELVCDSEGTLFTATDGGGVFRSTRTVPVEVSFFMIE